MRKHLAAAGTAAILAGVAVALIVVLAFSGQRTASASSAMTSKSSRPGFVGPTLPTNDLEDMLALSPSALAKEKTPVLLKGPKLRAVPRARCGAGSHPLAGEQGRVTKADINSKQAAIGWTCNTTVVGHLATPGGFRVWRYTDVHGHQCAYYDTSYATPADMLSLAGGPTLGVEVVDMSNPAHPRAVEALTSPAMLAPHESLNLNAKRGLLGAEVGNALTLPGTMDIYSVRQNCLHPTLESETPVASGHESGFSPDGRTFWVAGGAGYIYAFDVSNPKHPRQLWRGAYYAHGLNLSANGDTLYQTDPINGNLGLIDVSQIQNRKPHPTVHDISRITWPSVSIPQNTVPFESHGHSFLLEFDEFAFRFNPATVDDQVGAARIINIDNPARPRLISNIRLQVNMQAEHKAADDDPYPLYDGQTIGYAFHYCALPTQHDPQIVACSTLNSGLRVFNISNPARPREVAYFISPPKIDRTPGTPAGDLAFSQPAFDPARRQIWYTDAVSGLWVVTLSKSAWPR